MSYGDIHGVNPMRVESPRESCYRRESRIWLATIICYLAKISQKGYILHWFLYSNTYFEHPSDGKNGARSAKMAGGSLSITSYIHSLFILVLLSKQRDVAYLVTLNYQRQI